jgi:hypothetical protein
MNRYAIVVNGIVENIAAADADFASQQGWIELPPEAGIGWTYDGTFLPPTPQPNPVPEEVTNAQAREALIRSGISIASVDSAIQGITDSIEREVAFTQWEYRDKIRRNASLVVSIAGSLGLTESHVDDLFRAASTL